MKRLTKTALANTFRKTYPAAVSGNWCFFELNSPAQTEMGIELDGRYWAVTYQTGRGYDFRILIKG